MLPSRPTDLQALAPTEANQSPIVAYAEAKGREVKELYHLEAVSGKSVLYHPEAERTLKDVKTGHITGLIFSRLARLARNTKELLEVLAVAILTGYRKD